ncbi:hypothetical protein O7634_26915 [Micromonospora sp. WMMD1120]|uniref:hypothetical protein n=1 Tax=Micromonospora sp. WMMD1120 TaxID=3016106 RepID=UPI002417ED48|nr:hypothetical protein [Micromonospora sp. WMMD1120]MDG4810402.1 hypothetical protein [Micromonospora sp. WMMD1120]
MTEPRVRLDDLGAWLLKGNADAVDLAGRFARDPLVFRQPQAANPSYLTVVQFAALRTHLSV